MKNESTNENRRKFLKIGLLAGGTLAVGAVGLEKVLSKEEHSGTDKTVMGNDGKMYKTNSKNLKECCAAPVSNE